MEKTPTGTSVGVDDPYAHVGRCDHLTDDGRCRYAIRHGEHAPAFAAERAQEDYACPVVADVGPDWEWADCPQFRCRNRARECERCGLDEVRMAHSGERPLLEEHHLSYRGDREDLTHEITVYLCRWCHAKVHDSWARVDDDAAPDPEAIAAREQRRGKEMDELGFSSARERYDPDSAE